MSWPRGAGVMRATSDRYIATGNYGFATPREMIGYSHDACECACVLLRTYLFGVSARHAVFIMRVVLKFLGKYWCFAPRVFCDDQFTEYALTKW